MFISIDLRNFVVEIGVPEIFATKLSELNKLEYLCEPRKKNKLAAKSMANPMPIQEFLIALIKFLLLL